MIADIAAQIVTQTSCISFVVLVGKLNVLTILHQSAHDAFAMYQSASAAASSHDTVSAG